MISHAWVQLRQGGPSAKVVFCQCWWTGIQGISTLFPGGCICQSIVPCQCWWTGIQGISTLFLGGPSAKVYLSAKFYLLVVKAYMLYNLYESFYSHCFCCCCSVCYCCPCVIIYTKQQQQHEIIRRTRTTTKT